MAIRAVIFDLGGVILGSPIDAFTAYEAELGLPHQFLNRMIVDNGEGGAWQRLERGELAMPEFLDAFDQEVAAAGVQISAATLMQRVAQVSQPRPEMLAAIGRIREAGLRVAALTNNWASEDQRSKMSLLRDHFDVFVESVREGLRKPDPRIYALVCNRLGVAAVEAVFLDDIGRNLKPARAMGMTTIRVSSAPQALSELEPVLGLSLS